jgi:AraC family transcriptional regulator of adaptative response/methylated-DNA-[protein]-cysteine methyltransferase
MNTMTNELPRVKEMQKAVEKRNASYDGIFFMGVRTTGIFCRPSCPAKKPRPDNVQYFGTVRQALFAGYRPCKRCKPLDIAGSSPDWVDKLMRKVDEEPGIRLRDDQVRKMGIDPARLRRYFLRRHGMTFQAYCRARRMGRALEQIREGGDLLQVALEHGYESYSGFRDAFQDLFGQSPGRSRTAECILVNWIETPLGPMISGANSEGICFLEFTDRRMLEKQFDTLQSRFACSIIPGSNEFLDRLKAELAEYFGGKLKNFTAPVLLRGSEFQERVWQGLLKIPYGETRSYEDLARQIGARGAARAVGTANGLNRICILIPCHRVVNSNGKLGGYGGGLWRKNFLLQLEQQNSEFQLNNNP